MKFRNSQTAGGLGTKKPRPDKAGRVVAVALSRRKLRALLVRA